MCNRMSVERQHRPDDRALKIPLDEFARSESEADIPGKATLAEQIDQLAVILRNRTAHAATKTRVRSGVLRPGQRALVSEMLTAVPKLEFGDCQALALRDVLSRLRKNAALQEMTLAAADLHVARRVAPARQRPAATPAGQAMWGAAKQRAVTLYRRATATGIGALETRPVAEAIGAIGTGQPLPDDLRRKLEAVLGVSLADVRLHIGSVARAAAEAVNAEAFTVGEDIFLPTFEPTSSRWQETLAHEVMHCVQWRQGRIGAGIGVSRPDDPLEREAESAAKSIVDRAFQAPTQRAHAPADRGAPVSDAPPPMLTALGPTASFTTVQRVPGVQMVMRRGNDDRPLEVSAWGSAQRIEDLMNSVMQAGPHISAVGGEHAAILQQNWGWIAVGLAGSIAVYKAADMGSEALILSGLAAGHPPAIIAGCIIKLLVEAFRVGAIVFPVASSVEKFKSHAEEWARIGWSAYGKQERIDKASQEFARAVTCLLEAVFEAVAAVGGAIAATKVAEFASTVFGWLKAYFGKAPTVKGGQSLQILEQTTNHAPIKRSDGPGSREVVANPNSSGPAVNKSAAKSPAVSRPRAAAVPVAQSTNSLVSLVNGEMVPSHLGGGSPSWKDDDFVRVTPAFFESMWHLRQDWDLIDQKTRLGEYRKIIIQELTKHGVRIGVDVQEAKGFGDRFSRKNWRVAIPPDAVGDTVLDWPVVYEWLGKCISQIVEEWNALQEVLHNPAQHRTTRQLVLRHFPAHVIKAASSSRPDSRTIGPDRANLLVDAIIAESRDRDARENLSSKMRAYYASSEDARGDRSVIEDAEGVVEQRSKHYAATAEKARRWQQSGEWAADHQSVRPPPGAFTVQDSFFRGMYELRWKQWGDLDAKQRMGRALKLLNEQLERQGVPLLGATFEINGLSLEHWSIGVHPELLETAAAVDGRWEVFNESLAYLGADACNWWLIARHIAHESASNVIDDAVSHALEALVKKAKSDGKELTPGERERVELMIESMRSEEGFQATKRQMDAKKALTEAENALDSARLELEFQRTGEQSARQLAFKNLEAARSAWEAATREYNAATKAIEKRPEHVWQTTLARQVRSRSSI